MNFDYRKEFKEFYLPPRVPQLVEVPLMNFICVSGKGDPNDEDGEYKHALSLLYGLSFTIKMSYKGSRHIEGYYPYVVPPLEGLWQMADGTEMDYRRKEQLMWKSMIRLPEFATREVFDWAVQEATAKKGIDYSQATYFTYDEGLCVQCMHLGPYDAEPQTVCSMKALASEKGYQPDLLNGRLHHEIYMSDPRRCAPEKLKTVIRIPMASL